MPYFLRRVDVRNFNLEYDFFISVSRRWADAMVFLDTEFPDSIYNSAKPHYVLSPAERYALLKANVEDIQPIQVGITIYYIGRYSITWQFDLCDFDISRDCHVPKSITLLESYGLNLKDIRHWGVPFIWLAQLLINYGLIGLGSKAQWVVFQGGYDIAILLKGVWLWMRPCTMMTKAILPATLESFLAYTRLIFCGGIYDIKCLMWVCGLNGGLEWLAKQLMVEHEVGKPH
ncbi:hypothetical protein IEQ34_000243 [Dendrobium chrysotoxum]|uniref:Uncharacterized protein n=1 Tax=Dendrobium chrysotoxum TaxID=161865 RepID=A0AAV7H8J5_DENCH|nr:hypothetical protein IEQ34_000243 [Dendrobium chrysotoxum]